MDIQNAANVQNPEARLNAIKTQIEQGKTEKARAEANLEVFTKRQQEIEAQLKELGVAPENIDAEIAKLDQEIEANLSQAEALLRGDKGVSLNGRRENCYA